MKRFYIILITALITVNLFAQNNKSLEVLKSEFQKAVTERFEFDESGVDNGNLYLIFKKSPQEVITINLQKKHDIEFDDTDSFVHNGYNMTFYYAGFEKSAGLVVFLKNTSQYLVIGYNKPYMGEEIVKKEELVSIIDKVNLENIK